MAKKTYTFNVQVKVTLNDEEEPNVYHFPKELSKVTQKTIVAWLSQLNEHTDGSFEDNVYELVNCPVYNIRFCLE
jgi:hypothetical protein